MFPLRYIPPDNYEIDLHFYSTFSKRYTGKVIHQSSDYILMKDIEYGEVFIHNGKYVSARSDEHIINETMVHGLLSCLSKPKRVLIIGDLDGGVLCEVLKWPSLELVVQANQHKSFQDDYLKIGPEWIRKIYNDPRVKYINKYGLYFLEDLNNTKSGLKFDAIILGANEAEDIMGLRLFYSALDHLAEGGGIALYGQKSSDKYDFYTTTHLQRKMLDDTCKLKSDYTYFETKRFIPSCDLDVNTFYFVPKIWEDILHVAPRISSCRHFTKDQFKDSLKNSNDTF